MASNASNEDDCDWVFFYLEMVVSYIPALLFFITGTINFYKIRQFGFNRVVRFSTLFRLKLTCCTLLGFISFVNLVVGIVWTQNVDKKQYADDCLKVDPSDDSYSVWVRVLQLSELLPLAAWLGNHRLLIYIYRKGLSEVWYSHKMFWVLNVSALLACNIYGTINHLYTVYLFVQNLLSVLLNITLIYLMVRTKERTLQSRRPDFDAVHEDLRAGSLSQSRLLGTIDIKAAFSKLGQKEPKIDVRIKARTKDHITDEFKVVVNYQVDMSSDEKDDLRKKLPTTPMKNRLISKNTNNGYFKLAESESSIIEEPDFEDEQKNQPNDSDIESPSFRPPAKGQKDLSSEEDIKTINLLKTSGDVLRLQELVKFQFQKNAPLINFIAEDNEVVGGKFKMRTSDLSGEQTYPCLDQETMNKFLNMAGRKTMSGGQMKVLNVTQIFDEQTQQVLKDVETFFKRITRDKIYWTRDILQFFHIPEADINVFLNFHQVYRTAYLRRMNSRNLSQSFHANDERAGSYWSGRAISYANDPRSENETGLADLKSDCEISNLDLQEATRGVKHHIDKKKIRIVEDYIYGGQALDQSVRDFDKKASETLAKSMHQGRPDRKVGTTIKLSSSNNRPSLQDHLLFVQEMDRQESHSLGRLQSLNLPGQFPLSDREPVKPSFTRPQFRVQIKKWQNSNFGDYIEFIMLVQSLEGARQTWFVSKRYTDFVKLHEAMTPYFKVQLNQNQQRPIGQIRPSVTSNHQPISTSEKVVPILPPKIYQQDSHSLNERQAGLEDYINKVLSLMCGQAQFNRKLLEFIGFTTPAVLGTNPKGSNYQGESLIGQQMTDEFYDSLRLQVGPDVTKVKLLEFNVRIDPATEKPKTFFKMEVVFRVLKIGQGLIPSSSEGNSSPSRKQKHSRRIVMEKVYGDFKNLNSHLIETFQNEQKEVERFYEIRNGSFAKNGHGPPQLSFDHVQQPAGIDQSFTVEEQEELSGDHNVPGIVLSELVEDEFDLYGEAYNEEARRIITHLPRLPSKYQQQANLGSQILVGNRDAQKVSSEKLMDDLENYVNDLINLSPLVNNLFYFRDFLTKGTVAEEASGDLNTTAIIRPEISFERGLADLGSRTNSHEIDLTGLHPAGGLDETTMMFNNANNTSSNNHTSLNETKEIDESGRFDDDVEEMRRHDSFSIAFDQHTGI